MHRVAAPQMIDPDNHEKTAPIRLSDNGIVALSGPDLGLFETIWIGHSFIDLLRCDAALSVVFRYVAAVVVVPNDGPTVHT